MKGSNLPRRIGHNELLMFSGSCFSNEIGERCCSNGFKAMVNPGGTMFDPISLEQHIYRILEPVLFNSSDLFFHDGLFRNWNHYSKLGRENEQETLDLLNERYLLASDYLAQCNWLFVTFGTAWHYCLKRNQLPVANCHKMPSGIFEKKLISSNQIVLQWTKLIEKLQQHCPTLNLVFTVSPVKHLRDGIVENSRSKAILLDAVHQLCDLKLCSYFPSYELVNDVLRNHDFYKIDGAHPNSSASDFIYEYFIHNCFEIAPA